MQQDAPSTSTMSVKCIVVTKNFCCVLYNELCPSENFLFWNCHNHDLSKPCFVTTITWQGLSNIITKGKLHMQEKLTYLISIQQLVLSIPFARVLRQMWSGDLLLQKLAVIDLRFFRQIRVHSNKISCIFCITSQFMDLWLEWQRHILHQTTDQQSSMYIVSRCLNHFIKSVLGTTCFLMKPMCEQVSISVFKLQICCN